MNFLSKEIKSFKDAFRGIYFFFLEGAHAKFHLFTTSLVLLAGWYYKIHDTEWILLFICILIVIIAEIVNTSIELLCDVVNPGRNSKIGKIKDMAAAAVLVAAIGSSIIGFIVFIPYVLKI